MSQDVKQLLVATGNAGKLAEFRQLLSGDRIEIVGLEAFADTVEVEETGTTFAENSLLKAVGYAKQTGMIAIADDSGLEIDALDGRPGVHSARYLGDVTFGFRMENILLELDANGIERNARFVCCISIADPSGNIVAQEDGICEGVISYEPRGNNGFGYDPIFIPNGFENTFGELNDAIKNKISHRSVAISKIIPKIRGFIEL